VTSSIDASAGSITLTLQNSTATSVNFTITDNYGLSGPLTNNVPPGGFGTNVFSALTNNGGWYDLAVTADGDLQFLRQLGGHIETGFPTPTATNSPNVTIWMIIPPVTNSPSVIKLPPFTLPAAINPIPATNILQVFGVPYGTNFMVIYPNWASNCAIDFRTNLLQGSWIPMNAPSNILGNYIVVPVPLKTSTGFFRLRH
jgi:hypothetical protein